VGHVWLSPKPLNSSPDEGAARTSLNDERRNHHWMSIEDPFLPNQGFGMVGAGKKYSTPDGQGEASRLDDDTTSSVISMDDYVLFLADVSSAVPTNRREPMPAGNALATPTDASNYVSALEEPERPINLASAIRILWHSRDCSRLDYPSGPLGFHHPHEVGVTQLLPTRLDLGDWLALYPRHTIPEVQPHDQLLYGRPEAPFITWKAYAEYGYNVASQKSRIRTTPAETLEIESFMGPLVRRLVAYMLLNQHGSSNLRQCFSLSLNLLQPILERQFHIYKNPYSKIAKCLSRPLPASYEYSHQDSIAAILAMVCDPGFKTQNVDFKSMEYFANFDAQYSMERVLVWSCRLMICYADPALQGSLLPSDLCARALDGCKRILERVGFPLHQDSLGLTNMTGKPPFSDSLQDSIFATLWAEWICRDSEFFLNNSLTESISGN
jgi:hypothetical protein